MGNLEGQAEENRLGHVSYIVSIDEGRSSVGEEISKRETLWIRISD